MMVITMASYALQTPPRVAHANPPGPKGPKFCVGTLVLGGLIPGVRDEMFSVGYALG